MPGSPGFPDVFQSLQRSSWGEFEGFWLCINRNACLDLNLEQALWFCKCPKSTNSIISSAYLPVGISTSEIIARMLVMKVAALCLQLQNTRQCIQPFICIFSHRPTLWGRSLFEISRLQGKKQKSERPDGVNAVTSDSMLRRALWFRLPHPVSRCYWVGQKGRSGFSKRCYGKTRTDFSANQIHVSYLHLAHSARSDLLGPPWACVSLFPLSFQPGKSPLLSCLPVKFHLILWEPAS